MSTHKHIDKICCIAVVFALIITVVFMNGKSLGIISAGKSQGYESRLFATDRVHTLDIVMNDWDGFIETCENEEYSMCSVVIDGENYSNIGIRAKGNTSLSNVSQMNSSRYSFKLEFDQYDNTKSYYGLDKISLNNIIQDNTYMKDYLVYRMMGEFGVAAPLCSYVYITVNGEDFGLYLAVESIEESFLQRNYGNDYGELYKPDSMSFGAGRGNGKDFDFSEFENENGEFDLSKIENGEFDFSEFEDSMPTPPESFGSRDKKMPGNFNPFEGGQMPDMSQMPEGFDGQDFGNAGGKGGFGGMGSSDVKLQYSDDNFESYSNIFNNAKTDITDADKTRLIESLKKLSNGENIDSVVDIEQVIRYFVVHNFVVNGDSYTGAMIHNYYLYEKDGVMSMLPWDYNLAFGTFQSSDATSAVNSAIDSPVSGGDISDRPMIAWIFENEEYTNLYHEYFSQFISEYFDSGEFEKEIDAVTEMISPYVEKDPTKFCDYDSFVLGASTLKKFCMLRAESVNGQLCGTIPSTNSSNSFSSAVDASGINISDMGTMSMGGRGGMPEMPQSGGEKPQKNPGQQAKPETTQEATTVPETQVGTTQPNIPPEINGEFPEFNGQTPEIPEDFSPSNGQMPELPKGFSPSSGQMPPMNGESPNFGNEFPASPPSGVNPFGNGETSATITNQTA